MKNDELFCRNFKKNYKVYTIVTGGILVLELILIIRALFVFNFSNFEHIGYFCSYIFLSVLSLTVFSLLIKFRGQVEEKILVFKIVFNIYCVGIILWSTVVSFLDLIDDGSPIVFLTIIMGVACFSLVRPIYFLIMSLTALLTIVITTSIYIGGLLQSGILINLAVFELTAIFISNKMYVSAEDDLKAYNTFQYLSQIDQLTSLGNRRSLDDRVAAEHQKCVPYVFVLVDIDNFKHINDEYGHKTGDDVLCFVAQTLRNKFHNDVYRYGGDEMAIISNDSLEAIYNKCVEAQKELENNSIGCEVFISFGVYNNDKSMGPKEVFVRADKALYIAKNKGKNCGYVYIEE